MPGLAGYRIYHNGTFLDEINDPSSLTVSEDVLMTDGTNSFTMSAIDVNGNESAQSAPYFVEISPTANQLPTAVIQADVLSGEAPLTVSFDGTGSIDPDGSIVNYLWETGDGASDTADFFSYTFLSSGTYTVRLTVTDDLGATATSTVVITVTDPASTVNSPLPPTAVVDASALAGNAPLMVSFNGSWSSDPDGTVLSYQWDFGDGQTDTGAQVSHDFLAAGDYTVTLTVTDDGGNTATAQEIISITAQPSSSETTTKALHLQWSYDTSQPGLAGYRIYLNGQLVDTINDPSALTTDLAVGLVNGPNDFTMTAFDVNGNESAQSAPYVVDETQTVSNQPPNAKIQANVLTGEAPLAVSFDGTGSSDVDGSVASYAWDFGDGSTASGSVVSHMYSNAGSYTVRLTVTDDKGAAASTTSQIDVVAPVNQPPQAIAQSISLAEDSQYTGILTGQDPENASLSFTITRQPAHGTVELTSSSTGQFIYTPFANVSGSDSFSFTVSDGVQGSSEAQVSVQILPVNDPPIADIHANVLTGEAPLAVTFDGTGSSDVDGSVARYSWDFGDGVTASGSGVSHTYSNSGSFIVRLTVTDDQGATASASVQVDVVAPVQIQNVNNPPVANDDSVVVDQDGDVLVDVLNNDQDPNGDALTITAVGQPSDGVATIEANAVRYTPYPGYRGKDGFSYTISDGKGGTATAQVDIRVSPVSSNSGNGNSGNSGHGQGKH